VSLGKSYSVVTFHGAYIVSSSVEPIVIIIIIIIGRTMT